MSNISPTHPTECGVLEGHCQYLLVSFYFIDISTACDTRNCSHSFVIIFTFKTSFSYYLYVMNLTIDPNNKIFNNL